MSPTPGTDLDDLMVLPEATILAVMRAIDRTGLGVALVCDRQRRLLSVVTDGDIRRALINGQGLDHPIREVGNRQFTAVRADTGRMEAVELMLKRGFDCVPVIDADGKLVDLHTLAAALVGDRIESWAVVMAGGKGERLGDLTKGIPKPMLPIGDRPILEHIVRLLVTHGIRRIFISVNYLARMIQDHFGDGADFQCRIDYLHEREDTPLGTGGPLALLPETPAHPLVVMNGDLLTRIHIGRLLAFHRSGDYTATMGLREHVVQVPFGVAEVKESRIVKLVEKPKLNYRINSGIYVLNPELLPLIPKGRMFPITDLLNNCLQSGKRVGAYHMQETWHDIGLPDEYANAHQAGR
jgi:dTDP-glucose pyrophosphorylase/CBS domain-containing protein